MPTKTMPTKTEPNNSIDQPINQWPQTADEVLASAANIIAERYIKKDAYTTPQATKDF